MSARTPGPFTVGEMVRQSIRVEEPERTAALVLVEPGRVRQAEATANLFAAAPELLARLKARVKECPCCGDPDFPTELMCDECRADLDVIARAEVRA